MFKKLLYLSTLLLVFWSSNVFAESVNLAKNSGFENSMADWTNSFFKSDKDYIKHSLDTTTFKEGRQSLKVENLKNNDSRFSQEIELFKEQYYKISVWVKTENIPVTSTGANISFKNITVTSENITGTNDWKNITLYVKPQETKPYSITIGIGGYGNDNSGTAWFDDFKVEHSNQEEASNVFLLEDKSTTQISPTNKDSLFDLTRGRFYIALALISLLIGFIFYYKFINYNFSNRSFKIIFYGIFILGIYIRIMFAIYSPGQRGDISCNKSWALSAASNFFGFYNDPSMFIDYPPGAITIFAVFGHLIHLFSFISDEWFSTFIIKLPGIISDIVSAIVLCKISRKFLPKNWSIIIAIFYLLNPAVIVNSSDYGQVDGLMAMFILLALYFIINDKVNISSILFATAVLVKPQSIFLLPVLFIELLRKKEIKNFIISFLFALATLICIVAPFSSSKSPFWIFEFYSKSADVYKGVVINAFNFYALFDINWLDDSNIFFIFSYKTWGYIITGSMVLALIGGLYLCKYKTYAYSIYCNLIIYLGVFLFFSRVKERYIFCVVAFILITFIIVKDFRLIILGLIFSYTSFANVFLLYSSVIANNYSSFNLPLSHPFIRAMCVINLLSFGFIIYLFIRNIFQNKIIEVRNSTIE